MKSKEKDKEYYYQVCLDIFLKGTDEALGFINISQIPYDKFEELLKDQIKTERCLFDNNKVYDVDKALYAQHQEFLDNEIPFTFDFNLFEYTISITGVEVAEYKKDYYEELPPMFKKPLFSFKKK